MAIILHDSLKNRNVLFVFAFCPQANEGLEGLNGPRFVSGQGQSQELNPRHRPRSLCLFFKPLDSVSQLFSFPVLSPLWLGLSFLSLPLSTTIFCLFPLQAASERLRPSLLALDSDKICLCSFCLGCTCLFWMTLLIAIDSPRMWIAVPLDTRLMLLTFPRCPSSRLEGRAGVVRGEIEHFRFQSNTSEHESFSLCQGAVSLQVGRRCGICRNSQ